MNQMNGSDKTSKSRLGVIFGGRSSEYEISCVSAAAVIAAADKDKFDIYAVGITREGVWWLYEGDPALIAAGEWADDKASLRPAVLSPCPVHHGLLVFDKPASKYSVLRLDAIFPVVHGENCEDGRLQGLLEASGVPYVGCRTCSSAITMDKAFTKRLLDSFGIPQAKWISFSAGDYHADPDFIAGRIEKELGYPAFVKPANAGSSKGISKVRDRSGLENAIRAAAEIDRKIVVEEAVDGREIEVALLEEDSGVRASVCGEILPDMEFYSYDSKYVSGGSRTLIPAALGEEVSEKVRKLAVKVFSLLDCRGLSRADFFVKADGSPVFNEINSIPGFTSISMYP
ncbi:MAG: D-alanine--D-alanine ligase, partial [Clostridia bacterium]|nr:D-alanine--D-alanine ligase [Clostridia bacterium]